MPEQLFELGDLQLAWRRLKLDRRKRVFVRHPYLVEWTEMFLDQWLTTLLGSVNQGRYVPQDCHTCAAPKGSGLVRPGAVLEMADEVVYNAILGKFHDAIWRVIGGSQGVLDLAYQLQQPSAGEGWIRAGLDVWTSFREKSTELLDRGAQFVLFADIAAFYENIDLDKLASDQRAIGVQQPALHLLMDCLRRWSAPRGRGIPQGYSASDILAKLYVANIDQSLRNHGLVHLRYVDDVRIFCQRKVEAKKALLIINNLLRDRGLNLQSKKTEILRADRARSTIDGINPIIQNVQAEVRQEILESGALGDYGSGEAVEEYVREHPREVSAEIYERTFRDTIATAATEEFNKTLFHYLLHRLRLCGSRVAVDYCLGLLVDRPEETQEILDYLQGVDCSAEEENVIMDVMASVEAIYDYQLYEMVRWFVERGRFPERLLALCRGYVQDRNRSTWLRSYALVVLGRAGGRPDLELIEGTYGSANTETERAEIVTALARMELGHRNRIYNSLAGDGELVRVAIERVRGSRALAKS